MEWLDFDAELKRRNEAGSWGEAYTLCEVKQAFPDLVLLKDHWGTIKFCSVEANEHVDCIEMESCHACDGAPLKAWFYTVLDARGTKLYSNPPFVVVADQNQLGFGEVARIGWEELMTQAGISRFAISRVKQHLERHPPISYKEVEDEQA